MTQPSFTSPRVSQSTSRVSSQQQPRGSLSPSQFYREDDLGPGGLVSSMASVSMADGNRSNSANAYYPTNNGRYSSQEQQDSQRFSGGQQYQPYQLPSHHQPYQLHSSINNTNKYASLTNHNTYTPEHRARHDPYSPSSVLVTNGHNHNPHVFGKRPSPTHTPNPPTPPAPTPKAVDPFVGAGPLIDTSSRPLAADQVFARLAKQNPSNPRESDKRARINRWMDDVGRALVFNPDTSVPGWIIPVVPDDYDVLESPFYFDRITFELDIMAPAGKTLRKAIDINCAAGDWAMDMALKYPKTIVYAIDPVLNRYPPLPLPPPENCRFKLRDIKEQEGEFDLVHQRLGAYRILISEWVPHFAELGRLTRPGGWIQLAESNGMILRGGTESLKVNRWVEKAALSSGLNPFQVVDALIPTILGAGLINVECYEYGIPLGDWGGIRGALAMKNYLQMVESLREEIIETHRLEDGLFEEAVAQMQHECVVHQAELVMKVVCAQKPPFSDDIWRERGM
ncbi:hypothetical protein BG000_006824 [Podila horticola]|nr:hypothetical protein BG000_006824 [Podila horticola]